MSLDRNAADVARLRRNAQRQREGDGTDDLKLDGYGLKVSINGLALNVAWMESPTGTINGTNAVFTLAATPAPGFLLLFVNGLLMQAGAGNDYTISGNTITFQSGAIPGSGEWITATYVKAA